MSFDQITKNPKGFPIGIVAKVCLSETYATSFFNIKTFSLTLL